MCAGKQKNGHKKSGWSLPAGDALYEPGSGAVREKRVSATDAKSGVQAGQEGSEWASAKRQAQFYSSRTLLPGDTGEVSADSLTLFLRGWEPRANYTR